MWFISVELEQETSAPPPNKNPGSAPMSVTDFFGGGAIHARNMMNVFRVFQMTTFSQWP